MDLTLTVTAALKPAREQIKLQWWSVFLSLVNREERLLYHFSLSVKDKVLGLALSSGSAWLLLPSSVQASFKMRPSGSGNARVRTVR